jgi:hypothetical protein
VIPLTVRAQTIVSDFENMTRQAMPSRQRPLIRLLLPKESPVMALDTCPMKECCVSHIANSPLPHMANQNACMEYLECMRRFVPLQRMHDSVEHYSKRKRNTSRTALIQAIV